MPGRGVPIKAGRWEQQSEGDPLQDRNINGGCQTETASASKIASNWYQNTDKPKNCPWHCWYLNPALLLGVTKGKMQVSAVREGNSCMAVGRGCSKAGECRPWAGVPGTGHPALPRDSPGLHRAGTATEPQPLQCKVPAAPAALLSLMAPKVNKTQNISLISGLQRHAEFSAGGDVSAEFVRWKQQPEQSSQNKF